MKGHGPARLPALVKTAAAVALSAAVVIVVLLVRRGLDQRARPAPPPQTPITSARGLTAEKIRHIEFKSGRPSAEIEAARSTTDEKGLVRFEGDVRVRLHDRPRGMTTELSAGSIAFDRKSETFRAEGGLEAGFGRVSIRVPAGGTASYGADEGVFRAEGGFTVLMTRPGEERGVVLEGRSVEYRPDGGPLVVPGPVSIGTGDLAIKAGSAVLSIDAGGGTLERADLAEGVRIERRPGGDGAGRFVLEAERAAASFVPGTGLAASMGVSGGVKLKKTSAAGGGLKLETAALDMRFGEDGGMSSFEAEGRAEASVTEAPSSGGAAGATRLAGGKMVYSEGPGTLAVFGPSVIENETLVLEAPSAVLGTGSGRIEAEGGVKGYFKPGQGSGPAGLFEPSAAIYFVGGKAAVAKSGGPLVLSDRFRLWQADVSLSGARAEFASEGGGFTAEGGLKAAFPCGRDKDDKASVEASGMEYSAGDRRAVFSGGTVMRSPGYTAISRTASAVFLTGPTTVGTMTAEGNVGLVCRGYQGKCGRAVLEPGKGVLTMSGDPVLSGPEASDIRGDTLTLSMPDDRIFIERRGKGRSLILLKNDR